MRRIARIAKRVLIVLAAVVALVILLIVVTPQGRVAFRTALFVPQVVPGIPIKPQAWFTGSPTRQEVHYPLSEGRGVADLYLPSGSGKHSAVLLFLGVNPAGRDDPRVVSLAEGLASAGMAVMLPWSESMTQKRIDAGEVDNLVRGFEYLIGLDSVDPGRAGMGGFCIGASLAMVAAQDPRIRDRVRFINFFAGYYDVRDLVRAIVTENRFLDGVSEPWSPDALSVEVVTTHLIEGVADAEERAFLKETFIEGRRPPPEELDALSTEAGAVYRLLDDPALDEVDALMDQLSPATHAFFRRISPSTRIDDLKARVLVMHDREDQLVPAEESRRLVEALGEGRGTYHTEFSFFQHVDPTRQVNPLTFTREAFKLYLHMYNVLREVS